MVKNNNNIYFNCRVQLNLRVMADPDYSREDILRKLNLDQLNIEHPHGDVCHVEMFKVENLCPHDLLGTEDCVECIESNNYVLRHAGPIFEKSQKKLPGNKRLKSDVAVEKEIIITATAPKEKKGPNPSFAAEKILRALKSKKEKTMGQNSSKPVRKSSAKKNHEEFASKLVNEFVSEELKNNKNDDFWEGM